MKRIIAALILSLSAPLSAQSPPCPCPHNDYALQQYAPGLFVPGANPQGISSGSDSVIPQNGDQVEYWWYTNGWQWADPSTSSAFLVYGVADAPTPFHGGVLHPSLDIVIQVPLAEQPGGIIPMLFISTLDFIPLGAVIYTQIICPSASLPGGYALSNACSITRIF